MKKFTVFIFLLTVFDAFGQIQIGPKAGLTISGQRFDSDFSVPKTGFEAGIMSTVPFNENIALQFELLFSQKGYKEEYGDNDLFDQLTATYIQIPAMVRYKRGNYLKYYGNAGIFFGRWQSGSYRSRIIPDSEIVEDDYDFTDDFDQNGFKDKRTEFGLAVGAGIILPLKLNEIVFDVRYYHGLTDTNDLQSEPAGYDKRINQNVAITVAYLLFL